MGVQDWVSHNWVSLLQSAGIIGSLIFTGLALGLNVKARRNSDDLAITRAHRELWTNLYKRPELSRVLDPKADLSGRPVTREEELFILLLVVHLNTSLDVLNAGRCGELDEAMCKDIRWFFSLPIPRAVWDQSKRLQNDAFVAFVDRCLESK